MDYRVTEHPTLVLPESDTVEYVLSQCRALTVGITGTSGKSVAKNVLCDALGESGYQVGHGFRSVLSRWPELGADDRVVLEVPPAGGAAVRGVAVLAVTTLAADELGPGQSWAETTRGLRQALAAARRAVIVPSDCEPLLSLSASARAPVHLVSRQPADAYVSLVERTVTARNGRRNSRIEICELDRHLATSPALANDLLVAIAAALAAGATPAAIEIAVRRFSQPLDCLELLGIRGGVRWVSDARATRPGRAAAAMASLAPPVLLIAGGAAGGQSLNRWAACASQMECVLVFGSGGEAMAEALSQCSTRATIVHCLDLDDALTVASRLARRGDTVLFSPGCEPEASSPFSPGELFRQRVALSELAPCEAA